MSIFLIVVSLGKKAKKYISQKCQTVPLKVYIHHAKIPKKEHLLISSAKGLSIKTAERIVSTTRVCINVCLFQGGKYLTVLSPHFLKGLWTEYSASSTRMMVRSSRTLSCRSGFGTFLNMDSFLKLTQVGFKEKSGALHACLHTIIFS